LEPGGRALLDVVVHRRSRRLERDDRLDERRPCVGYEPAERARLRVRHQYGGADAIEQGRARIAIELLLPRKARERRIDLGEELIEDGIAGDASARPLGVESGLRPQVRALGRREALLYAFHREARLRPHFGLM